MSKAKAWITLMRLFAVPWIVINIMLGVWYASYTGLSISLIDILMVILACVVISLVLIGAHLHNAYKDYVYGYDKLENGSTEKIYTSACGVIPSGVISSRKVAISSILCYSIASALMLVYVLVDRCTTLIPFGLGMFAAVSYNEIFKRYGLMQEVGLFLGHGVTTVLMGYVSISNVISLDSLLLCLPTGLFAAMMLPIDQLPDVETDGFKHSTAALLKKTGFPAYVFAGLAYAAVVSMQYLLVLVNILPIRSMITLMEIPIVLIAMKALSIDSRFQKGILIMLIAMMLYPILIIIGGAIL